AVLKMSDFIGESYVVRMCRPRHSSVLAGGGVHGMKVGWKVVLSYTAGVSIRIEQDFSESISGTCRHEASFAGGQVGNRNLQSVSRILQDHAQHVARIVEERVRVRCERAVVLKQWARRSRWHAALGNKSKIYVLNCSTASCIVPLPGVEVLRKTVDVQRRSPPCGVGAVHPAWRVELHLHERGARMLANVAWHCRV